jgi:hypothetical protein
VRTRFWIETASAALCGVLGLLTLVWGDWIEAVFRVSPDNGDGSLEWAIVAALFLVTVVSATAAYAEWTRSSSVTDRAPPAT